MSTKKKGLFTVDNRERARHLRKYGKRVFWGKERAAVKKVLSHSSTVEQEPDTFKAGSSNLSVTTKI